MEICKNKITGKAFIYLDDDEYGMALMITPQGEIKALEHDLFTEPAEIDDVDSLPEQYHLTDAQYDVYREYDQM